MLTSYSLRNIHRKVAEITHYLYDHYQMFVCDEHSCDFLKFIRLLGMACIFYDDTFLHATKDIFFAKFTSVILPEIVSRQYNMITDTDFMHVSTSSV